MNYPKVKFIKPEKLDKNTIQIEESRIVELSTLKDIEENSDLGELRFQGNLKGKGFYVPYSEEYDWVLVRDVIGELVLLPLKKIEKNN